MTPTGGILKVLPLRKFGLASSRQARRTQKRLLSASAARTSQPKSTYTRPDISTTTTGKPPATPFNQHGAEPLLNPFGQPRIVSSGKLPPNYNATARRVLTIMVGLPVVIVTSYVLVERLYLGRERKLLAPRPEEELRSAANDDIPWDSPVPQPDKYQDSNEESLR